LSIDGASRESQQITKKTNVGRGQETKWETSINMKPSLLLCLTLVLSADFAFGHSVNIRVPPNPPSDWNLPVSVQVTDADFGKHFTVLLKHIGIDSDEFVGARLEVCSEDNQIASCPVEKKWTTNGVQFEFKVSPAYLQASRFRVYEIAHRGRQPMPAFTAYWFYLRDFATNGAPVARQNSSLEMAPDILKALPKRVQSLRPGTTADEVWKQLNLAAYKRSLSNDTDDLIPDRYRLSWNYAIEFNFEKTANDSTIDALEKNTNNFIIDNTPYGQMRFLKDNRKLIRAILYKNGLDICHSRK